MPSADGRPSNPVLLELATLLKDLDAEPNLDLSDFSSCRALGATTKKRCERTIANKKHRRNAHLASFNKLAECPHDDEQFYEDVEDFLFTIHCGQHYNSLVFPKFVDWKEERSQQTIVSCEENYGATEDAVEQCASEPLQKISDKCICSKQAVEEVAPPSEVDAMIGGLSVMALDADHDPNTTQNNRDCTNKDDPETNELALTIWKRPESITDPSPVKTEMYEYPAPEEQVEGMKLSPQAPTLVQGLQDFSPESMRLLVPNRETSVRITTESREIMGTTTAVTKRTVVTESTYQIFGQVTPSSRDVLTRPSTAPGRTRSIKSVKSVKGRESLGTTIERLGHKAKQYLGRRLTKSGEGLPRKVHHGMI